MNSPALQASGLTRRFDGGRVRALDGVDLACSAGDVLAIVGPSGCGKSTLLSLLGMLDRPNAGAIRLDGVDYATVRKPHAFRGRHIGIVFQSANLLPSLSAVENVMLPLELGGMSARAARQQAMAALEAVGLADLADRDAERLSGGEQQRVAIARALVGGRGLLLADEPTAALDSLTGESVMRLLRRRCDDDGIAVVMTTHDASHAAWADRVIFLRDGGVVDEARPGSDSPVSEVSFDDEELAR